MKKTAAMHWVFDCIAMLALAFLFALNYELFIVKNHFAPAGINGIATMIQYKSGFSIGYFSLIVNVPLCVFAFFCISREFAVKTAVFSIAYSLFVLLLETADLSRFQYDAQGVDTIYPVLIAGAVDLIFTFVLAVLCIWAISMRGALALVAAAALLLLIGTVSLFEAYLIHAKKRIPLAEIVNVKNIALLFLGDIAIFLLALAFTVLLTALTNSAVGIFIGMAF